MGPWSESLESTVAFSILSGKPKICIFCIFFAKGSGSCLTCKLPSHELKPMFQELRHRSAFKGQFSCPRLWMQETARIWILARLCTHGCELLHKKSPAKCSCCSFIHTTIGATPPDRFSLRWWLWAPVWLQSAPTRLDASRPLQGVQRRFAGDD